MRSKGMEFENLAANYLRKEGLKLISKNYQCRSGEIDLVMSTSETLVFVEVKYRKNATHGTPLETVTRAKQNKLIKCAKHFMQKYKLWHLDARFDVVGISNTSKSESYYLDWIPNAFTN